MNNSKFLLFFTFISSIGDTLFLVGLPVYFYKSGDGNLLHATFVSIFINLIVFISRKFIIKLHTTSSYIKVVAYGEIIMGVTELIILILFNTFNQKWILLVGIIPLALLYNIYAVPKFYHIQDSFETRNIIRYTSMLSFFREFGMFSGILIVGFLMEHYTINEIIIVDAMTFIIYGLFILLSKKKQDTESSSSKGNQVLKRKGDEDPDLRLSMRQFFITSSFVACFFSWGQSSAVSVINNWISLPYDQITFVQFISGGVGVTLGFKFVTIINKKNMLRFWSIFSYVGVLLTIITSYSMQSLSIIILFFTLGFLKAISDATKKLVYDWQISIGNEHKVSSIQWTYEAFIKISLVPLAYIANLYYKNSGQLMALYLISLLLIATLFGYWNYEKNKRFINE